MKWTTAMTRGASGMCVAVRDAGVERTAVRALRLVAGGGTKRFWVGQGVGVAPARLERLPSPSSFSRLTRLGIGNDEER